MISLVILVPLAIALFALLMEKLEAVVFADYAANLLAGIVPLARSEFLYCDKYSLKYQK